MLILAIDTSCDDTSAALLQIEDEHISILSNIVSTQGDIHAKYGGIVPEIASRMHTEAIWPVVEAAMQGRAVSDLSAIAVCHGPGLIGSLLVGCSFAKSMSWGSAVDLVGVNHLEGHLLSAFLTGETPEFPFISLIVSGGHTSLYLVKDYGEYEELGRTRDDAAGEAYDKVAKMLGLPYPGGPAIDRLAQTGDDRAIPLPRPYLPGTHDFSFSGLKTAVRLAIDKHPDQSLENFCASFQRSVVEVLVRKTEIAMRETSVMRITINGGVAANSGVRKGMQLMCEQMGVQLYLPPLQYCTDNAAMIAIAGYYRHRRGERATLDMNPRPYLPLV